MKFLKDNWYKLMTGTAMLIFACGFFIYAVSPSYANQTIEVNKRQIDGGSDDIFVLVDNGYLYSWFSRHNMWEWVETDGEIWPPKKTRLP